MTVRVPIPLTTDYTGPSHIICPDRIVTVARVSFLWRVTYFTTIALKVIYALSISDTGDYKMTLIGVSST